MEEFKDIIKRLREQSGHTQFSASKAIGKSEAYFGNIESGKFIPSEKTIIDIAKLFNTDPREILEARRQQKEPSEVKEYLQSIKSEIVNEVKQGLGLKRMNQDEEIKGLFNDFKDFDELSENDKEDVRLAIRHVREVIKRKRDRNR
ncbi:MAG: helix-turn-helix transcriptional regulator [Thermodesulfobacteriota bacterium]